MRYLVRGVDDAATGIIQSVNEHHYLLDPHTAVAMQSNWSLLKYESLCGLSNGTCKVPWI